MGPGAHTPILPLYGHVWGLYMGYIGPWGLGPGPLWTALTREWGIWPRGPDPDLTDDCTWIRGLGPRDLGSQAPISPMVMHRIGPQALGPYRWDY